MAGMAWKTNGKQPVEEFLILRAEASYGAKWIPDKRSQNASAMKRLEITRPRGS